MKKYFALVAVLFLSGCSAVDFIGNGIGYYCDKPAAFRAANREAVAVAVAPNRIEIECAADG